MDLFDSVSPLDYRYYGRAKSFDNLKKYFSENARIQSQCQVERALVAALAQKGIAPQKAVAEVEKAIEKVTAEAVYAEEDRTHHDIRSLVNVIRAHVSEETKPFVHFGATSFDIIDTSNALRYKKAVLEVLAPKLKELRETLSRIAMRERDTVQIGRTHGQHAEPITFGFFLAGYVSRLDGRIRELERCADNLVGKFSGAVGAYNATALLVEDPLELEELVMRELGLKVSPSSTQIVEPEPTADLLHAVTTAMGVLANLADDMRNLQRTEIGETAEAFEKDQVGSSTMPHKRNPWNFENVKSFWKTFAPRMITAYSDQISEHQRDLTNSASSRFAGETILGAYLAASRMNRVLARTVVDHARMKENFDRHKDMIIAEPLYILLAKHGHPDAHEYVRELTLRAQKEKRPLTQIVASDAGLAPYLEKFTEEQRQILREPEKYTGRAAKKTEKLAGN